MSWPGLAGQRGAPARRRRNGGRGTSSFRRLALEPLESRMLMAVIGHNDLAGVAALSQATMDVIGRQTWFFTHASVGGNMLEGMGALHASDPTRYQLDQATVGYNGAALRADDAPATTTHGTIYECDRGNPGWADKVTIFENSLATSGWRSAKIDVVMNKFCFIDQDADAASYLASMNALAASYPGTQLVYMTMPLTTASDADNVLRNNFNTAVRDYCVANNRLLLDIADVESYTPGGAAVTFSYAGHTYQRLYSGYTDDGGHLNATGQQRIALGWYASAAAIASGGHGATPGLYDPATSMFYMRNGNSSAPPDNVFGFGAAGAGWKPVSGDWNGDGVTTIGVYDPATSMFYLRNTNSTGPVDYAFGYGDPAAGNRYVLMMGDWNGDGIDTVGLYDTLTAQWYLRNTNTPGYSDISFGYGVPGSSWSPVVGDWNGDGIDTIGFYDAQNAVYYLRNTNDVGYADICFGYGVPGSTWTPIMGDWDGNHTATIGFYDPASCQWYLRNSNDVGMSDISFGFGPAGAGWLPIAGKWTGASGAALMATEEKASSSGTPIDDSAARPILDAALARWSELDHLAGLADLDPLAASLVSGTLPAGI